MCFGWRNAMVLSSAETCVASSHAPCTLRGPAVFCVGLIAHFPQLFGKNAATHALATLLARAICCAGWGERCFASTSKTAPCMQALPTAGSGLAVELFGELAVIGLGGVRPPHRSWTNPRYPRRVACANILNGLLEYLLLYILFFEGDMQCLSIFAMMPLTIWLQRS